MKALNIILVIVFTQHLNAAPWSVEDYEKYQEGVATNSRKEIAGNLELLKKAKYLILNGQIDKARFFLGLINDPSGDFKELTDRYHALIYFIEDKNEFSHQLSSGTMAKDELYYQQYCLLRLSNELSMDKVANRDLKTIERCRRLVNENSGNNALWINRLLDLLQTDQKKLSFAEISRIRNLLSDNEQIRIWLKLALFLNQEEDLKESLSYAPEDAYRSRLVRELMGLLYYRLNDFEMSLKFIEDIDSANAENIKGYIRVREKKYELAYGHFALALKLKENSINALDQAIPITWLLGKYQDGLDLLNRAVDFDVDQNKMLVLKSVFLAKSGEYDKAMRFIEALSKVYPENLPMIAHESKAYLSILQNKTDEAKTSLEYLCKNYSGFSCYLANQLLIFPDFMKFGEELDEPMTADFSLLKTVKGIDPTPLEETVYVKQSYIEELDRDQKKLE